MILEDENLLADEEAKDPSLINQDLQGASSQFSLSLICHDTHLPVEERLIKKGMQYKYNLNQRRHERIQDQIASGPTFQPQLIANNEPYLQRKRE